MEQRLELPELVVLEAVEMVVFGTPLQIHNQEPLTLVVVVVLLVDKMLLETAVLVLSLLDILQMLPH